MSRDRLRIVCTDGGEHPPRDLGMIVWSPDELHRDGAAVWDATGDQTVHGAETMSQTGRTTRAGQWRTTERGRVTTTTRKDGGVTFTFPSCPTCRSQPRTLRDTTLGAVLRGSLDTLDVSQIP